MLSAFFLLLAVMLAGGSGPSTAQVGQASAPSQSSPIDVGNGGRRPVPVVSKQQLYVGEASESNSSSGDDGKSKVFLPAKGLELQAVAAGLDHAPQAVVLAASFAASPFDARAPPAKS